MTPVVCEACGEALMPGAFFCGECGSSTRPKRDLHPPTRTDTRIVEAAMSADAPRRDVVIPRFSDEVPPPSEKPARETLAFTMKFANGDSITVEAGGLLGRNPTPNPGEQCEHLIIVTDPDRTVSKTHLEFGIEESSFWVCDRFSGNGTTIHEPGKPPRRLVPGRRYRVDEGATVRIGEQSFHLSSSHGN